MCYSAWLVSALNYIVSALNYIVSALIYIVSFAFPLLLVWLSDSRTAFCSRLISVKMYSKLSAACLEGVVICDNVQPVAFLGCVVAYVCMSLACMLHLHIHIHSI